MARLTNKDRINTVNLNRCVVYRMGREELTSNIVSRTGGGSDEIGYLVFTMNGSGSDVWNAFKQWWKKNQNAILIGLMIYNTNTNQNGGYYWCPVNRAPGINRTDTYTNKLEFCIARNDQGIFDDNSVIYEFYFINLSH